MGKENDLKKYSQDHYDPDNLVPKHFDLDGEEEEYIGDEKFIQFKADNLFHIGQGYDKAVAETIFCKHCGGNNFNVGQGDHFTSIRCVNCKWEKCIHEG